jgi:hypothetical protein
MKEKGAKKAWTDPVKGRSPRESTMETKGNFAQFRELMKKVVKVRSPRVGEPTSASPGPGASS